VLVPGTGTGVCQHRVVDPSPCRVLNMCVAGWRCAQLLCPSECWQGPGACARVCVCVPTAVVSLGTDLLPQSTLCSRMWGMPVLSLTGVRNTAPKVLFSSLFTTLISWAPAQVCRQGTAGARGGGGGGDAAGYVCTPRNPTPWSQVAAPTDSVPAAFPHAAAPGTHMNLFYACAYAPTPYRLGAHCLAKTDWVQMPRPPTCLVVFVHEHM
jgi:hypothetical protein